VKLDGRDQRGDYLQDVCNVGISLYRAREINSLKYLPLRDTSLTTSHRQPAAYG
jgi:hypothetical protein